MIAVELCSHDFVVLFVIQGYMYSIILNISGTDIPIVLFTYWCCLCWIQQCYIVLLSHDI